MTFFDDVGEFHEKFGVPHVKGPLLAPHTEPVRLDTSWVTRPGFLRADIHAFRRRFLDEELREFDEAVAAGNLPKAFDALVDLTYVVQGFAQLMGLPFNEGWAEVHRANLTKERRLDGKRDPRSTRGHVLDVVKPIGFVGPDLHGVLTRAGWREE